jgi:hypothetical protein
VNESIVIGPSGGAPPAPLLLEELALPVLALDVLALVLDEPPTPLLLLDPLLLDTLLLDTLLLDALAPPAPLVVLALLVALAVLEALAEEEAALGAPPMLLLDVLAAAPPALLVDTRSGAPPAPPDEPPAAEEEADELIPGAEAPELEQAVAVIARSKM